MDRSQIRTFLHAMGWGLKCREYTRQIPYPYSAEDLRVIYTGMLHGSVLVVTRLAEAFKNLDDRGWDHVNEGLADPLGAEMMLLSLLASRGNLSPETMEDHRAKRRKEGEDV